MSITVQAKADRVQYLTEIFFDFLFEEGPDQRLYSGDDFQTKDIARSPGADQMRDDFLKQGCTSSPLTGRFYPGSYDSGVAYRLLRMAHSLTTQPRLKLVASAIDLTACLTGRPCTRRQTNYRLGLCSTTFQAYPTSHAADQFHSWGMLAKGSDG